MNAIERICALISIIIIHPVMSVFVLVLRIIGWVGESFLLLVAMTDAVLNAINRDDLDERFEDLKDEFLKQK